MIMPGLINLDFADIRTVMSEMGKAMMGTGEASGDDRAVKAAEAAIANPLLDHSSMCGARGVLINITGGMDMTLFEVDSAANRIRQEVGEHEANIIFGSTFHPDLDGVIRVSVVATGIEAESFATPRTGENLYQKDNTPSPATNNYEAEANLENNESFSEEVEEAIEDLYGLQKEEELTESSAPGNISGNRVVVNSEQRAATDLQSESAVAVLDKTDYEEKFDEWKISPQQDPRVVPRQRAPEVKKASIFSKMWNSLKSHDRQDEFYNTEHVNNISEGNIADQNIESDVQEIPAFLRKHK